MIINRKKLSYYINQDHLKANKPHRIFYIFDEIGRYLYYLRKREYFSYKVHLKNKNIFFKFLEFYYRYRQHKLGVKLGFGIPINSIGPGFSIDHWGFVAINGNAQVGKNCHIYGDATIGIKNNVDTRAPIIGDNVTIGAGARIIGNVKIASGVTIGANAVVIKDVLKENSVVAGVPAKYIS